MAFSFGNTSGFGATSTPAKPGFGNFSFGGGAATPAQTSFGAPQQPAASTFGQAPTFGSTGFGSAPATAAPSFGFGAPTATTASAFNFAGTAAPAQNTTLGGFGAPPTTSATGFGGFGGIGGGTLGGTGLSGGGMTTGLGMSGGFGTFGAQSSAAPTAFGTTTTSTNPGFGFGAGLSFGQAPPASTSAFSFNAPAFGATASAAPSFGGFGSSFQSTFNKPAAPGFGTFGQPQQQLQQQPIPLSADDAFAQSVLNVSIFGDERDTVIAKWNYLQALWGKGKAYYSQNAPPVEITPQNFLCRFKAIGYNKMPGKENKMGLVALVFNKPESQISGHKDQVSAQINQVLGNKPNILVNIDSIKTVSDSKCHVIIFIQEKSQISNETKRILATDVVNVLNQPMAKSQLTSMGIEDVIALVTPDEDQLKEYLDKPPKGIDIRMWKQAIEDNPDPTKFIPVPIVGFDELKLRIQCQEKETETHALYLAKVQRDLTELKQKHIDATATILGHKRKLADLSHRILNIIVKQEITRKIGVALTPEEEELRSKLENMQAHVSAPTQYKGRLSELLSQMRMQRNQWNLSNTSDYALDPDSADEMRTFLCMQQKAMGFLIETANKDMATLKDIQEKLAQYVRE